MSTPLVVVGAGGFGRETLDVVESINRCSPNPRFEILGVVDDSPSAENLARLKARDVPHLGTVAEWLGGTRHAHYLIGIGDPAAREQVAAYFDGVGQVAAIAIHPASTIGSVTEIGPGSVICGGVQVSTGVTLGKHVHLNPNATVGHDARLDDFVSVNPSATISGSVRVGRRTLVGAGAVVLQGLTLGTDVMVGASACVVKDVLDATVVKGVPAR